MRNVVTEAVILRKYRIGEIHKGLKIFSPTLGIINVIAHGAYKMRNRFRIVTEPFSYSLLYLYLNPIAGSYKLTDVEAKNLFEGIRGDIKKFYTASLWSEIIMESRGGGGDFEVLFNLFVRALSILDAVLKPGMLVFVSIQFLWRFLKVTGYLPSFRTCSKCGRVIENDEEIFYSPVDGSIVCGLCRNENQVPLTMGARAYIKKTGDMELGDAIEIGLENESVISLKNFLYLMVQKQLDLSLKTLESGVNFL